MGVWYHRRKGRIVGDIVSRDEGWTQIRLSEDAWSDVRHRHFDLAGSVQTYRSGLLVEMSPVAIQDRIEGDTK